MERTSTSLSYNGREVVTDVLPNDQMAVEMELVESLLPAELSVASLKVLMTDQAVLSESDSTANIEAPKDNVEETSVTPSILLSDDVLSNAVEDMPDPTTPQSLFKVRDVVDVESRVWPGINKPGGIARVINVHSSIEGVDSSTTSVVFTYDVKYLVGQGGERDLEENFLSRIAECGKERNTLGKCREIGCPSFIKDCKHIQPGQPGYRTPAQREEEAQEQVRAQAAERAKKVVEKPVKKTGAEDEVEASVEAGDRADRGAEREEHREMRRVFKENQRAGKILKREARTVIRREKRANEKEVHSEKIVNRGVGVGSAGASGSRGAGGVVAVAVDSQHGLDFIVDTESDSESDSDDTDTSLSESCSEVDGSNSDYEDVYNYEEGSPEMIDANEEMGFCNADTEGIHVDYLPRAKKIKFTEEDNTYLPESDEQFNNRIALMRKLDLEKEKKKNKRSVEQNFAEAKLNSKIKKVVDIEEMIFTSSKVIRDVKKKRSGVKGTADSDAMSDSEESSDEGSVHYFSDSDQGGLGDFASTASNTQQDMYSYGSGDRARGGSSKSSSRGYEQRDSHGTSSNPKGRGSYQHTSHSAQSRGGRDGNQTVKAPMSKGHRDGVVRGRERAHNKSESRDKPYTSIYSGMNKSRDKGSGDAASKSKSGTKNPHRTGQTSESQSKAAVNGVKQTHRTVNEDLRAQRVKAVALKESVTALRVADSLLARSSTGFLPSYKERDSLDWNNRLLSPSNLRIPLLTLSGLSALSVTSHGEEMEFDRGRSQGREDADDDNIEVQLEVAVAVQQHLLSLRVAAAEQLGAHAPASTEAAMHNCTDREGQKSVTLSAHRIRLSFKLADRAMKKRDVSRHAGHLNTAPQDQDEAPDAASEGAVGAALCSKAFAFIFSLLQSDSSGTVLLLEGGHSDDCEGQDGYSAAAANAVKDFLDFCDIFEKQWILPRSRLSEKDSAASAGSSKSNGVVDNHKHGYKGLWQGVKFEGKGEKDAEPPSLSSLLISSITPPKRGMQSKKRRSRRRFLESRSTREGKEAVVLALKYYTKKSEAVHTIAKRARERILDVSAALKRAIIDAKKADFDVLQYQASIPMMVYNDSNSAESRSSREAERSLRETAYREEQQRAQGDVSNLTHELKDWEAALKLSRLALSALWGEAVHAALSSPCLMVEAARTVLSGGLHTPSASDPSPLYLSSEISMGYLQFWIACTLGKQEKSTQISRDGLCLSRPTPVTTTKRELNSPAHGWQCIATHISDIQRSQADPKSTSPVHLTASRIALVMAMHTYILASSSSMVAAPCPSTRVQKKAPVCGAWELLTPLCCSASTWEDRDAPLDGVLTGLQLMSLSLASRACKLWVGAEKNAFPLFVSTAASLLTVKKQSTVCAHSDGVAGTGTAASDKVPPPQSKKAPGDDLGYEVLAWGALQGKSVGDTERGGYREKAASDDLKRCTQSVNPSTDPHASIDVIPLSLYITSQAALSCSPLRCDGGYRCTRSYLHVMMTQLSSGVFTALHLQSPLEDPVTSTARHGSNSESESESESVLLQLLFASKVPQDRAAASTVFYLTRTLRRMLVNTVAAGAEKEATAMHTRLRTSCNANLLNLLDMPRMAALTCFSSSSSSSIESNQSSDTFSLTEGVCLCMALRVVADTVPQGESLFRITPKPSKDLAHHAGILDPSGGTRLQSLARDWQTVQIHSSMNHLGKNALYLLLAAHALPPLPALQQEKDVKEVKKEEKKEKSTSQSQPLSPSDWLSLSPLLTYAEAAGGNLMRSRQAESSPDLHSIATVTASVAAVSACLAVVNSCLLDQGVEDVSASHHLHGTADVQQEDAEGRAWAMSVGPSMQGRLVSSLLTLLSCEIPLGERAIGPLGYSPSTPRFQTLVQGLCLLATSTLVWERSSGRDMHSHEVPAGHHAAASLPLPLPLAWMQEQRRERECAWSFCYKSFSLLIGPAFLKLLRGESIVGSVITACSDSELRERLRERSCPRLSCALSIASALADMTATRTLMVANETGQRQVQVQGQGPGTAEVLSVSLSILDRCYTVSSPMSAMLKCMFWTRYISSCSAAAADAAHSSASLPSSRAPSTAFKEACLKFPASLIASLSPHIVSMLDIWMSCACALFLQPLLLLRDIRLHTYHSALIVALEEVLSADKQGTESGSREKEEGLSKNKGYGAYGRTVNNSTDIYKFKSTGTKSAADQLRDARTRSLEAYLRILRTAERPSTVGAELLSDASHSVTAGESAYMLSVRQALCGFVLSIGSETVMLDLPLGRAVKDVPYAARGVAAVTGTGTGMGIGIGMGMSSSTSGVVHVPSLGPLSQPLEDLRPNLLLSIHSGVRYAWSLYLSTQSATALTEMHSLTCLLTVQSPLSNPNPSQQLCIRLLLCSTGILAHVHEACELLESVVMHRGWGGLHCLHMLAVYLPLYVRVLASAPTHGSHAAAGMMQLLSYAWKARKHSAFCITSNKAVTDTNAASDRTSNERDVMMKEGDLARNLILAWAIGLSLPHSSSPNPSSSSPASISLSTSLEDVTKIHDYFITLADHPKSARITLLDTLYCYGETAVSTLIIPTLKLFLNRALAEQQYEWERETQSRDMTACGTTTDTPPVACTTHHLLDALLGAGGDHYWRNPQLVARLDGLPFLRLAVTLHSYSMKSHMQNALKKTAVGSLWGEDPIPLMACACVVLSLCRMLLTRSCDPVTDENKNSQVTHTNITNTDASVKAVQHPISAGPLSAEEEQYVDEHFELLAVAVASGIASFTPRGPAESTQGGVIGSTGTGVTEGATEVTGLVNSTAEHVLLEVAKRKESRKDGDKMRRQCVAVVQRVCVIAAGVTLKGDPVRDVRKVLQSLLRRCLAFLNSPIPLPLPLHPLPCVGAVSTDTKAHLHALQLLEKASTGPIKCRALSDVCRSNARKLIRTIQEYYE